eukprot:1930021-Pleurochrysis_carterae.AAC.5
MINPDFATASAAPPITCGDTARHAAPRTGTPPPCRVSPSSLSPSCLARALLPSRLPSASESGLRIIGPDLRRLDSTRCSK